MIFGALGRIQPIRQAEAAECALACVVMIAGAHGRRIDVSRVRHEEGMSLRGADLRDVMEIAASQGLVSRPIRLEPENLFRIRLPAILHWDVTHFVVLERVSRRGVTICDPARGRVQVSRQELDRRFSGVAAEIWPGDEFQQENLQSRLRLSELWSGLRGVWPTAAQVLALTLLVQTAGLVAPLYMQVVVDEVLVKGDVDLAKLLAFGFAAMAIFGTFAAWLHGATLLNAGAAIEAQTTTNVFSHLLKLPLDFFERRHIGEIQSRLESLSEVTEFLSDRLIEAAVDVAFAIALVVILWLYNEKLAAITLAAMALKFALHMALHVPIKRRNEDTIIAGARKETHTIETLSGFSSIRMAGGEERRRQAWLNLHADEVNAGLRLGRMELSLQVLGQLIVGLETILVVYVAAKLSLAGEFTVGMLLAFMAYRQLTMARIASVIDFVMTYRMLDLHLERLSDIVRAKADNRAPALPSPALLSNAQPPKLSLHGVGLRYGPREPWVFENIDFSLEPGARVAINGPSGCGKSSLLRVVLGLHEPCIGEVRLNGRRIDGATLGRFRTCVSAVLQEDTLFSGSLAENITFFDSKPDLDWMQECTKIAEIAEDIEAMPMDYDSMVGNLGSSLSSGQKQRLLLARALYHRPRILVLDEGTAHLDPAREDRVLRNLAEQDLSLLFVAHRETAIMAADRLFTMGPSGLIENAGFARSKHATEALRIIDATR